jgi:translation initiation factor 1A
MPPNKGKGGKKKRRGKNDTTVSTRFLIEIESDDQEYARVNKLLGDGRMLATCFKKVPQGFSSKDRVCKIRGSMRKRVWINVDDFIMISVRDCNTNDDKADVIHKYNDSEVRKLMKKGQLPNIVINAPVEVTTEKSQEATLVVEEDITFDNDEDSDEDDFVKNI